MKIKYSIVLIFNILSLSLLAQDRIIKITNDTISCQIKEIGDDEIKYTQKDYKNDLIFGIDKNKVSRILFSDGKELKITDSMFDVAQYDKQRKNALKVGFLSPLVGATNFSYEHSLKPGSSIEGTVGIIGLGIKGTRNAQGLYLKFGYKLIKTPDIYQKGMRFYHILNGAYLRPEISIVNYSVDSNQLTYLNGGVLTNGGARENNTMFATMLNVGKQWVFADRFLIDWFFGMGYGFGHAYRDNGAHFAFMGGIPDFPLAVTTGLRIGFLF